MDRTSPCETVAVLRRTVKVFAICVITALSVPVVTAGTVLASLVFLPLPAALPDPRPPMESQPSIVYDAQGNEIGVFRQFDLSIPIRPEDIPEVLKQAVIASEDRNFYSHGGVDPRGTMRALWANITEGEIVQGGSTITQQYVKNAYIGRDRTIVRKIRETILASQLDRQVEKEEILYRYLQQVFFGEGAYGVGAAAQTYFRKHVRDLSLSESALLAGLIPAPSRYEPRGNPEVAEARRKLVLDLMLEVGFITPEEHADARSQELWLLAFAGPPPEGQPVTIVFPPPRVETAHPYFVDYVRRYMEAKGYDIYGGGYHIYTTMDRATQLHAEAAVNDTLAGTEPPLEMALVAVEPPTGFVRALVGGRDFNAPGGKVNLALGAQGGGTGRQTGSAFKAFVLANAFEKGIAPSKRYSGAPHTVGNHTFRNYGGASYGTMDLRQATIRSVNTVFTRLIQDVGVEDTVKLANRMGVRTAPFDPAVHGSGVPIALGALDTSPHDMAVGFGVFAARGVRVDPVPVWRVLDADGQIVEDNLDPEPRSERVLEEITADNVNDVMRGVFNGTASGRDIGRPAAGKTGTAQDHKDAWFVGYTPTLSTAVWMGYRDRPQEMRNIKGVARVTGGSWPARTWQAFMRAALAGVEPTEFTEPAPIQPIVDQLRAQQRRGFAPGPARQPRSTGNGGDYVSRLPPPEPRDPPTTTTTTTVPSGEPGGPRDEGEGGGGGGLFGGGTGSGGDSGVDQAGSDAGPGRSPPG